MFYNNHDSHIYIFGYDWRWDISESWKKWRLGKKKTVREDNKASIFSATRKIIFHRKRLRYFFSISFRAELRLLVVLKHENQTRKKKVCRFKDIKTWSLTWLRASTIFLMHFFFLEEKECKFTWFIVWKKCCCSLTYIIYKCCFSQLLSKIVNVHNVNLRWKICADSGFAGHVTYKIAYGVPCGWMHDNYYSIQTPFCYNQHSWTQFLLDNSVESNFFFTTLQIIKNASLK